MKRVKLIKNSYFRFFWVNQTIVSDTTVSIFSDKSTGSFDGAPAVTSFSSTLKRAFPQPSISSFKIFPRVLKMKIFSHMFKFKFLELFWVIVAFGQFGAFQPNNVWPRLTCILPCFLPPSCVLSSWWLHSFLSVLHKHCHNLGNLLHKFLSFLNLV